MASEWRQNRRLKKLKTKAHKMTPARKAALEKAVKASALKRKTKNEKKLLKTQKRTERLQKKVAKLQGKSAKYAGRSSRATARLKQLGN